MRSYEAIQKAISGKTVEFARKLGLSTSLVTKWQEPHTDFTDSGAYNPLDRVETVIETSLSLGNNTDDAYAPIQYLTERFGLILLKLPKSCHDTEAVSKELLQTIKEFGEMAEAAGRALQDGKINPREAGRIEKEAWDLIRQTASFIQKIKECNK